MSNYKIIEADREWLDDIVAVEYENALTVYPNAEIGITPKDVEEWAWDERSAIYDTKVVQISDRKLLIAEYAGNVLGFAGLTQLGQREAHLWRLNVRSDVQRRGIGSALLSAAERDGMNAGSRVVVLDVAEYNHQAISFYKKHGYTLSCDVSSKPSSVDERIVMLRYEKPLAQCSDQS